MIPRAYRRLWLPFPLTLVFLFPHPFHSRALDEFRAATVPGLAVLDDGRTGVVHYIAIQISTRPQLDGPVIQFSEIHIGGGSLVGDSWKESVKRAVRAALNQLGVDGRDWVVTIKNRSYNAVTDGMSASGAVAVGVMAAWRGDPVRPKVAMTGQITQEGRIAPVGSVPQKVEAAAREHFKTVLVPRGQLQTTEWDLTDLAARQQLTIVEVGTLEEAYRTMASEAR
jgi:predicted S18 family serine protease